MAVNMHDKKCAEKIFLPHHEQQELCTTRLPYRQGRKLTAVKVYTINNESNHLLIFGVPSLNLRQEIKSLFSKFGKLIQFNITTDHPAEVFTETFHAKYEKIQSARIAKKMLDTKNFYGGSLHVCYAPELESFDETRQKIVKRKQDVLYRLRYLEMEDKEKNIVREVNNDNHVTEEIINESCKRRMNMGEFNTIIVSKKKVKKMKPTPIFNEIDDNEVEFSRNSNKHDIRDSCYFDNPSTSKIYDIKVSENNLDVNEKVSDQCQIVDNNLNSNEKIEAVDLTSTEKEVVSNINEALNYNNFGNEIIKKVPYKPVNKIIFNINNKNS